MIPVFAERCTTCVFRPGNRMRLAAGRLADLVASNRALGTLLVCHLTTYDQRPELGEVLCRGYFDAYADESSVAQIMRRFADSAGQPDPFVSVPLPGEDDERNGSRAVPTDR